MGTNNNTTTKISSQIATLLLVTSISLNIYFLHNSYGSGGLWKLRWTQKAAAEAEAVASISCSGHGKAYLDGLLLGDGYGDFQRPVCECSNCYGGPHCSLFDPSCPANANGGDPLFLEPFWMQHAASSAIVVAGWHRMSYSYSDDSFTSAELETHIRKLHAIVGNAATEGKYIIFGAGSTQLLNAAVHALSIADGNSSSPAKVVAKIPFYTLYQQQTEFFDSKDFEFEGDISKWKNKSDFNVNMIEFVTAPNNPDGQMNKAFFHGPNAKTIYDHAYYWPHFTAIPSPADGNVMIFTISKLTGHAGSRFGWAFVKDESIYQGMVTYLSLNTMGVSRDTQLRALKLIKTIIDGEEGKEIFRFGYETMTKRWEKLRGIVSKSKRFSLQTIPPSYCNFFQKFREATPAYAWLRCEREEDTSCYAVLEAANIIGRPGRIFFTEDRYVRLSLIRSQDDFNLLLQKLDKLVSEQDGPKTM